MKALAVYRDGSKEAQPVSVKSETDKEESKEKKDKIVPGPRRERLQDTRRSITHKFSVNGHEGYITVGLYPDGRPGELFITMAKEGSTVGGLMDCFGTAVSMSLQYGVPLNVYVNKFSHTRFEPMGYTKNRDIPIAKSVVDYIFRWMGLTFLPGYREGNKLLAGEGGGSSNSEPGRVGPNSESGRTGPSGDSPSASGDATAEPRPAAKTAGGPTLGHEAAATRASSTNGNGHRNGNGAAKPAPAASLNSMLQAESVAMATELSEQFAAFQTDAPSCDNCGAITVRSGNCYLCHVCGTSMGCS